MIPSPTMRLPDVPHAVMKFSSLGAVIAPAVALTGLIALRVVPLNHDSGILLDCGRELVQGAVPYVDYVETNPPLSHYLHALPVLLAKWTGLGLADAFMWWTLGLVACSVLSMVVILRREPSLETRDDGRHILVATWLCFSLTVLSTVDFGQREHLFMLGFMPWLCFRLRSGADPGGHWHPALLAAGLSALFALAKPHFVLLFIVVEAWLWLRTRRWSALLRLDLLAMSAVGLAYAVFLFVPHSMRESFFGRWMPFVAAHYSVYDEPWTAVWLNVKAVPPALVAVSGLVMSRGAPQVTRIRFETLAVAILAALSIYYAQGKGWGYHLIPAWGLAFLFAALQILALADRAARPREAGVAPREGARRIVLAAAGIGIMLASAALTVVGQVNGRREWQRVRPTVETIEANSQRDEPVAFVSTDVRDAYPALIYSGRPAGTRYLQAFPIAMFYEGAHATPGHGFPYRRPGERSAEEDRFLSELGEDVRTRRPALVFVGRVQSQGCPPRFTVQEYLHQTGWFDRYMEDYELVSARGRLAVYVSRARSGSALDPTAEQPAQRTAESGRTGPPARE